MLIRTHNPLGFELEYSLKAPKTFFLRIPRVCEVFHNQDFGLVFSTWKEVAGKPRQTTILN